MRSHVPVFAAGSCAAVILALGAAPIVLADDVYEENDDCASAASFGGSGPTPLFISSPDDDWYVINAQTGSRLVIDLDVIGLEAGPAMRLHDVCGGPLLSFSAQSVFVNPSPGGPQGDYFLRVRQPSGTCEYKLRVSHQPPPDVAVTGRPGGWASPVVPQNDPPDFSYVPLPAELTGTYFAYNIRRSVEDLMATEDRERFFDDVLIGGNYSSGVFYSGDFPGSGQVTSQPVGGRHTIKVVVDPNNREAEINEGNNVFEGQWVWRPIILSAGAPLYPLRSAPRAGSLPNSNCDGYQFDPTPDQAWAIGMAPANPAINCELPLYSDYSGSQSGFSVIEAVSSEPAGRWDFVVGSRDVTASRVFPGVYRTESSGSRYSINAATSGSRSSAEPSAAWSNQVLPVYEIVQVFEGYFTTGQEVDFSLQRTAGGADVSFSLFPSGSGAPVPRSMRLAEATASGADLDELNWTCPASGWYPVVIHRGDGQLNTETAAFTFGWTTAISGVGDPTRALVADLRLRANPAHSRLRFDYVAPPSVPVAFGIFDVMGRQVSALVDDTGDGSWRSIEWEPKTASGRRLPAGTYFLRMDTGSTVVGRRFSFQ